MRVTPITPNNPRGAGRHRLENKKKTVSVSFAPEVLEAIKNQSNNVSLVVNIAVKQYLKLGNLK